MTERKKFSAKEEAGVSIAAMLMVTLRDDEKVAAELGRRGYRAKKIPEMIDAARERIVQTADFNRREELGRMLRQFDDQYVVADGIAKEAARDGDRVAAARLCMEITTRRGEMIDVKNQLDSAVVDENVESEQLRYVRGHLEALGVGEKGLPLEELARQVSAEFAAMAAALAAARGECEAPEGAETTGGAEAGGAVKGRRSVSD